MTTTSRAVLAALSTPTPDQRGLSENDRAMREIARRHPRMIRDVLMQHVINTGDPKANEQIRMALEASERTIAVLVTILDNIDRLTANG